MWPFCYISVQSFQIDPSWWFLGTGGLLLLTMTTALWGPAGISVVPHAVQHLHGIACEVTRTFGLCCQQYVDDIQLYLALSSEPKGVETTLRINPDKAEVVFVGSLLILGSGNVLVLDGVTLTPKAPVCSFMVLLDPAHWWMPSSSWPGVPITRLMFSYVLLYMCRFLFINMYVFHYI